MAKSKINAKMANKKERPQKATEKESILLKDVSGDNTIYLNFYPAMLNFSHLKVLKTTW